MALAHGDTGRTHTYTNTQGLKISLVNWKEKKQQEPEILRINDLCNAMVTAGI